MKANHIQSPPSYSRTKLDANDVLKKKKLSSPTKFYARQSELQKLHRAYRRMTAGQGGAMLKKSSHQSCPSAAGRAVQFVLIQGPPGVGKSKLVEQFQHQVSRGSCRCLAGKAEEAESSEPFAPLVRAFATFCQDVDEGREMPVLRDRILQAVGADAPILGKVLPCITKMAEEVIVGTDTGANDQDVGTELDENDTSSSLLEGEARIHSAEQLENDHALNRFSYVFQRFVQALCSVDCPLLLFLDDMQWFDEATFGLLRLIVSDPSLEGLMLLGTVRDDEVDETHPLSRLLVSLEMQKDQQQTAEITVLDLEQLNSHDVHDLVADAVGRDDAEVSRLADMINRTTLGNILFTLEVLRKLEETGVIQYHGDDDVWSWDVEGVKSTLQTMSNVEQVVISNLRRLPKDVRQVLTTAAFLKSPFTFDLLRSVLSSFVRGSAQDSFRSFEESELLRCLDDAVGEGVLYNLVGTPEYKFAHDKFLEATKSLISAEDGDMMQLKIGSTLLYLSEQSGHEDGLFFTAVDRINAVSDALVRQHMSSIRLAKLNLQAGKKAARSSAFQSASRYFRRGIDRLKDDSQRFTTSYNLCLQLYTQAAQAEFTIGKFDVGKAFADDVLIFGRTFEDKLPAYVALSNGLGKHGQHEYALKIDCKILEDLGYLPKRLTNSSILWKVRRVKRMLEAVRDSDILASPRISDDRIVVAMESLSRCLIRSFYCKRPQLYICCALKQIRLTLRHGLCDVTGFAMSSFAITAFGRLHEEILGRRLMDLALQVSHLTKTKRFEAKTLFAACTYVQSWTTPVPVVLEMCSLGHKSGMESGDVEFAFLCSSAHSRFSYLSNAPLKQVFADSRLLMGKLRQYQADAVVGIHSPFHRLLEYLTGKRTDLLQWYYTADQVADPDDLGNLQLLQHRYIALLQALYLFGHTDLASQTVQKLFERANIAGDFAFFSETIFYYFRLLVATRMYRKNNQPQYKNEASQALRLLRSSVKRKGLNAHHRLLIMEAEFKATFGGRGVKDIHVRDAFEAAIIETTRAGMRQDTALAHELLGEYFERQREDFWTKHHYSQAWRLYGDWGATAKADYLQELKPDKVQGVSSPTLNKNDPFTVSLHAAQAWREELMRHSGSTLTMASARDTPSMANYLIVDGPPICEEEAASPSPWADMSILSDGEGLRLTVVMQGRHMNSSLDGAESASAPSGADQETAGQQ